MFSGFEVGYNNLSGSNNIFAGTKSGHGNQSGSSNIFLVVLQDIKIFQEIQIFILAKKLDITAMDQVIFL